LANIRIGGNSRNGWRSRRKKMSDPTRKERSLEALRDLHKVPTLGPVIHRRHYLARVVALTVVLAACGADQRAVERRVDVLPAAVHVVGTSEAIARITDIQPIADGRVWLLNSVEVEPFFVLLGSDGRVEREFGRHGGGPAEFGAPLALVRGPDGEVWTYDLLRHALIRISTEERGELLLPRDSFSPPQLISFVGAGIFPARPWLKEGMGGFLFARVRPGSAPPFSGLGFWNADVVMVRADSPAAALEVYSPVADLVGDPASRYSRATKILPYPLWAVCGDGTVALYDPLENELRRIGGNGGVLEAVVLPHERRVEFTFERMLGIASRDFLEQATGQLPDSAAARQQFERMFSEWEAQSARVFPEYADLHCAHDGTAWLQPFDVVKGPLGRGPNWYRFSQDGSRTLFVLPEDFRALRFEADRIWGTVIDSLGITSAAWIGVDA
jgi:hypothetical protein